MLIYKGTSAATRGRCHSLVYSLRGCGSKARPCWLVTDRQAQAKSFRTHILIRDSKHSSHPASTAYGRSTTCVQSRLQTLRSLLPRPPHAGPPRLPNDIRRAFPGRFTDISILKYIDSLGCLIRLLHPSIWLHLHVLCLEPKRAWAWCTWNAAEAATGARATCERSDAWNIQRLDDGSNNLA